MSVYVSVSVSVPMFECVCLCACVYVCGCVCVSVCLCLCEIYQIFLCVYNYVYYDNRLRGTISDYMKNKSSSLVELTLTCN